MSQTSPSIPNYGSPQNPPHAPEPEAAKLGPLQRLTGILFSPGETFQDINRKPTWLAPMLIAIVVGAASVWFTTWWTNPDWNRITREMIRKQVDKSGGPTPSEDRIQAQVKGMTFVGKLFPAVVVVVTPAVFLIAAGAFALGLMLMQAQTTFKKILSATTWTFCGVGLVSSIVNCASLAVRDRESLDTFNPLQPGAISATNLSVVLRADISPVLRSLAASLDIFHIWILVLLAIGLAAVAGSRKITSGKTGVLVVGLWLVLVCLGALGAAVSG